MKDNGIAAADVSSIQGTGFQGGITERDIKASPLARKLAEKTGVDLSTVQGTGAGEKIMKKDVERAAAAAASSGSDELQIASVVPYKGVRKIIGDKLAHSKFTAPHLYFTDAVDTTNLTAFRKQLNENSEVRIAVSDLLIMAACKALKKFPGINVTLKEDQIVTYKSINIGTAVAGDNGLVVPVVKNVQNKSLTDVAAESKDLVARAKEGRLKPEEYSNGTFSISNLGMFGIGNFTAIINAPEAAILSVSSQNAGGDYRRKRGGYHRHPAHDEYSALCGSPAHRRPSGLPVCGVHEAASGKPGTDSDVSPAAMGRVEKLRR